MLVTLPPMPCVSICLTASWVMKMNPSRLVETKRAKILGRVVREGLGGEDARIVDEMVDRAEPVDRGLRHFLGRRGMTDVSVDEREVRRRRQSLPWKRCAKLRPRYSRDRERPGRRPLRCLAKRRLR